MADIPPSLRDLINGGPLAHLATINPDGSPQVTVIWVGWDGDDLVSGHMGTTRKMRNLQRDPRVVVSAEAPRVPGTFLAEYAVLTCTATVEEGGAWTLLDRLTRIYVDPDGTFPVPQRDGGYVVRYGIGRISGVGPWAGGSD